jgi:hypothetical protein
LWSFQKVHASPNRQVVEDIMVRVSWSILILIPLAWGFTILAGFVYLLDYENTPGAAADSQMRWPLDSHLALDGIRPTVIMAIHPHCACSRTSISELAETCARRPGAAAVHVLFYKPAEFPEGWERTDTWRETATIKDVELHCDEGGVECRRFAALTSGQVMVFSPRGDLLFMGGVTRARGHAGGNPGREALLSILTTGRSESTSSPVFGCALFDSETPSASGGTAWRQ